MSGKKWLRWGGILLVAVSLVYFMGVLGAQWSELPSRLLSSKAAVWLAALLIIYAIIGLQSSLAWHLLMRATDERAAFGVTVRVWLVSQLAKYVPGNIAHHVSRVSLAHAAGYAPARVVLSIAVETAAVLVVAALLAGIGLLLVGDRLLVELTGAYGGEWKIIAALGLAGAMFVALRLARRRLPDLIRKYSGNEAIRLPKAGVVARCCLLYAANYALVGAIMDLLALNLFDAQASHFITLTGLFAAAWVVGFLTPGAPAGIGVRELILLTALSPIYGTATAIGLTAAMRIVTTLGDGLLFVLGMLLYRHAKAVQPPAAT